MCHGNKSSATCLTLLSAVFFFMPKSFVFQNHFDTLTNVQLPKASLTKYIKTITAIICRLSEQNSKK